MKYHLSNRQKKELGNGKILRIALPYPDAGIRAAHVHHDLTIEPHNENHLVDWAADHLQLDGDGDIVFAEITLVPVDPTKSYSPGLAGTFGMIISDAQKQRADIPIRILCVVVE